MRLGGSPRLRPSPRARDLALVGFVVTGISYGPARMGFGLFLPTLRTEFGFSSTIAGFLAAGLFTSFTVSVLVAGWLTGRAGPRAAVVTGMVLATAGLLLVAVAPSTPVLALGLVLAGASAGLCWSPFNDAAVSLLAEDERPTTLSVVSTGTTVGVLLAGLLAGAGLLTELSWRWSWLVFAVVSAAATGLALSRMPGRPSEAGPTPSRRPGLPSGPRGSLVQPTAAAASFGLTSSVYLAFAGDRVTDGAPDAGLLSELAAPSLFVAYGLAGLLGLFAGRLERRRGLRLTLAVIFAASTASLALLAVPVATPAIVLASAGLQGAAVMVFSAVLSFWTARLRPLEATRAFSVTLIALAAGGAVGPALAGVMLDLHGAGATFTGAAALSLLTGVALAARRTSPDPPRR